MAEYYAVVRSDDYLQHYGIRGMRWHVRRAIKKGNKKAYQRQYAKAIKKMHRLEKQATNKAKYTRKAIVKGAKVLGTGGMVLAGITNPSILAYRVGKAGYNAYRAANTEKAAKKLETWRNEMAKEFNADALYDAIDRKRRKRH